MTCTSHQSNAVKISTSACQHFIATLNQYAGYYYVLNPGSITGSMNYKKNHEKIMAELFDTIRKSHKGDFPFEN